MKSALEIARRYDAAGFSVIPVRADGSKAAAVAWTEFQTRRPTEDEHRKWFGNGTSYGFGIVWGKVSGNGEALDFDAVGLFQEYAALAADNGFADLLNRLVLVATPSGGQHLLYRCEPDVEVPTHHRIARRLVEVPEGTPGALLRDGKRFKAETLIETRGEGGYTIAPGSPVACHPDGRPYELLRGRFDALPVITAQERAILHGLAVVFNEFVDETQTAAGERTARTEEQAAKEKTGEGWFVRNGGTYVAQQRPGTWDDDLPPGKDFNERADLSALLKGAGWEHVADRGGRGLWRRPGKDDPRAISGTTNYGGANCFYAFSTNCDPFPHQQPLKPFGVYAYLKHAGDFGRAALDLWGQGYGREAPEDSEKARRWKAAQEAGTGSAFRRSDTGNAERLLARHGEKLRYDHTAKCWYLWAGNRWEADRTGQAQEFAKETVLSMYAEAADPDKTEEERAAIATHAKASDKAPRIQALLQLALSDARVAVTSDEWDTDRWVLNVENGTLDLRTGELHPHRAADLITKMAPVSYDPNATAPTWEAALNRWHPDTEVRAFLQRAAGYSLTGHIGEETAFFTYGLGRNGKSKFVGALESVMGDYAARVSIEVLTDSRKAGNATPDLIPLVGARLVVASEVQEGRRLNESFIKDTTGGDRITARANYGNTFTFRPQFKLWLYGNHKPVIKGTDDGIWARLPLIPFTVQIPKAERDQDLAAKLAAERAGILAWAVRGCLEWQTRRLSPPAAVVEATNEYRQEMDPIAGYVGERCKLDPDAWTASAELFKDYEKWAEENGERHPLPASEFSKHLVNRYGCKSERRSHEGKKQVRGLTGIRLSTVSCDTVDTVDTLDSTLSKTAHENEQDEVTQNGAQPVYLSTGAQTEPPKRGKIRFDDFEEFEDDPDDLSDLTDPSAVFQMLKRARREKHAADG